MDNLEKSLEAIDKVVAGFKNVKKEKYIDARDKRHYYYEIYLGGDMVRVDTKTPSTVKLSMDIDDEWEEKVVSIQVARDFIKEALKNINEEIRESNMRVITERMMELAGIPIMESDAKFEKAVETLVDHVQALMNKYYKDNGYTFADPDKIVVTKGGRYWRIVKEATRGSGRSVWGFVDSKNGDVLKPNSWKAPHPTPRGNVYDKSTWKSFDQFGPGYLR